MEVLLICYVIFSFFGGLIFAFAWLDSVPFRKEDFILIWAPNHFANEWCSNRNINKVGHFFIDIVFNLIFAPITIIAIIFVGIMLTPLIMVALFAWLFRKR